MPVRFSVLVPTYNRQEQTRQAIESVLAQTFASYELLVIDDGSTDGTAQMLASFGERIRALRQANQGPEVARNTAAALAQGEYLVLLDSDDLLIPCALETYDRVIRALDSPPLLIGSMAYFEDGQPVPPGRDDRGKTEVWKCPDYLTQRRLSWAFQTAASCFVSRSFRPGGWRSKQHSSDLSSGRLQPYLEGWDLWTLCGGEKPAHCRLPCAPIQQHSRFGIHGQWNPGAGRRGKGWTISRRTQAPTRALCLHRRNRAIVG